LSAVIRSIEREAYKRIHWFAAGHRVILAHADQAPARIVADRIRVSQRGLGRNRTGRKSRKLFVKSLISEIREINYAVSYYVITAAIFVNERSGVERRRIYVCDCTRRVAPDNYVSAPLRRPHLNPVDVLAVHRRLGKSDRLTND
jgi:hypothetical protein